MDLREEGQDHRFVGYDGHSQPRVPTPVSTHPQIVEAESVHTRSDDSWCQYSQANFECGTMHEHGHRTWSCDAATEVDGLLVIWSASRPLPFRHGILYVRRSAVSGQRTIQLRTLLSVAGGGLTSVVLWVVRNIFHLNRCRIAGKAVRNLVWVRGQIYYSHCKVPTSHQY